MMVFFQTRLGKILIWQKFFKHENPTLSIIFCGENAIQVMKEAQSFYYYADVQIAK